MFTVRMAIDAPLNENNGNYKYCGTGFDGMEAYTAASRRLRESYNIAIDETKPMTEVGVYLSGAFRGYGFENYNPSDRRLICGLFVDSAKECISPPHNRNIVL